LKIKDKILFKNILKIKDKILSCIFKIRYYLQDSILHNTAKAFPVSKRDKNSLDFTLTRSFMKLFHTSSVDIVTECQINFNVLPIRYQIDMKTTRFLLKFVNSSNSICSLFFSNAYSIVNSIFSVYGVSSVSDMCSTINEQFEQLAHRS